MEEEKRDNKKAGMRRALNVRDILNKKYDVFPFEGEMEGRLRHSGSPGLLVRVGQQR